MTKNAENFYYAFLIGLISRSIADGTYIVNNVTGHKDFLDVLKENPNSGCVLDVIPVNQGVSERIVLMVQLDSQMSNSISTLSLAKDSVQKLKDSPYLGGLDCNKLHLIGIVLNEAYKIVEVAETTLVSS